MRFIAYAVLKVKDRMFVSVSVADPHVCAADQELWLAADAQHHKTGLYAHC